MYRKNTAGQRIYFNLTSKTSGDDLAGATVTVKRALDGSAQADGTGTVTDLGGGHYRYNLSQADTNADNGSYVFRSAGANTVEKTVVFTALDPTDNVRAGIQSLPNAAANASGGLYVIGGTQPSFPAVPSAADNAAAVLGASVGVDTVAELLVDMGAALVGTLSGADGSTQTVKAPGTSTTRLVYSTDASGNRTAVTRSR